MTATKSTAGKDTLRLTSSNRSSWASTCGLSSDELTTSGKGVLREMNTNLTDQLNGVGSQQMTPHGSALQLAERVGHIVNGHDQAGPISPTFRSPSARCATCRGG